MTEQALDLYKVAEIELIYKQKVSPSRRPKIGCSKDAYNLFLLSWDENKISFVEQAKVMLLNRGNQVLGICEISTGGITGTVVDQRLVFVAALKANASSIVLAHNHPSGNLNPSEADVRITDNFKKAGQILTIEVLDHLIVSNEGYYSFSEGTSHFNSSYCP